MTGQLLRTTVYTRINGVPHVRPSSGSAVPLHGGAYTTLVLQKTGGAGGGGSPPPRAPT